MDKFWNSLADLDRRWLFALTFLAISIPLLTGIVLPQKVTPMVKNVFNAIDELPTGTKILMPLDYDPSAEGELQPMADAFIRHAAQKNHKIYFMTIWPTGVAMIQRQVAFAWPASTNGFLRHFLDTRQTEDATTIAAMSTTSVSACAFA